MFKAKLSDILTDFTCLDLVSEFTKCILYSKQQIPYTYDKLNLAITVNSAKVCFSFYVTRRRLYYQKVKLLFTYYLFQSVESTKRNSKASHELFNKAKTCVDSFEEIFKQLSHVFSSENKEISEVVFLFGGSIMSPKQIYRMELPAIELGHRQQNHSRQQVLSELLK